MNVRSIRIEKAEGGYMVYVEHEPEKARKSKGNDCAPTCWEPPKPIVYTNIADLHKCLDEHFGGKSNGQAGKSGWKDARGREVDYA